MEKAYYTISEVCELLKIKPHTIRYWETEFTKLKKKTTKGSARRYTADDIELLKKIKELIVVRRFTLEGAKAEIRNKTSSGDFQSPPSIGGFQSPHSSGDFQSPPSSGDFQSPPGSGDFQSPPSSSDFQSPHNNNDAPITTSPHTDDRTPNTDHRVPIHTIKQIKNTLIEIKSILQNRRDTDTQTTDDTSSHNS